MLFNTFEPYIDLDARTRIYEYCFRHELIYMLDDILSSTSIETEDKKRFLRMFVDVRSIARLAVVYNVQDIFEKSIQILSKASETQFIKLVSLDHPTLLEICGAFQRNSLQEILPVKLCKEPQKTPSSTVFSTFECLFCLLIKHPLSIMQIKNHDVVMF